MRIVGISVPVILTNCQPIADLPIPIAVPIATLDPYRRNSLLTRARLEMDLFVRRFVSVQKLHSNKVQIKELLVSRFLPSV